MRSLGGIRIGSGGGGLCALAAALFLSACSSHIARSPYIKTSLVEQDYESALAQVEKIDKSSSRLLYLYEKGLVLHYKNSYEESNAAFEEAEELYDDLYTKSVTRELASLVTSDNLIKYRGERYEAALIHYYKILNYLYLRRSQGAVVECRKLNNRLQTFEDDEEEFYSNDPFLQYFTGMVYTAMGQRNDADVSLRVALAAYEQARESHGVEIPAHLYCDLAKSAEMFHDAEAASQYRERGECERGSEGDAKAGVLNLFLECGYAPHKIEENVVIPLYKDEVSDKPDADDYAETLYRRYDHPRDYERKLDYLLRVAIPSLVTTPSRYRTIEVRTVHEGTTLTSPAQVVENLEVLAFRAFDNKKGQIIVKTIARGLTKYFAKEGAEDKKGVVAGWLVNALNVATESADSRSWSTLPQTIRMARLVLPEGTHDVEVVLFDEFGGSNESFVIPGIEIKAGGTIFLNHRIY